MKILLAASERFSGCIIEALERRGHQVTGVVMPPMDANSGHLAGVEGLWLRARGWDLASCCRRRGIPVRISRRLDDDTVTELIKSSRPDLLIIFRWPTKVRLETLNRFAYGGLNIHPTLLPALRGADPLFHMLDSRQDAFGITFHKLVEDMLAGPVILQERLVLKPGDTCDDLYFRLLSATFSHLPRAINKLLLNPEGTPQRGEATRASRFRQSMRFLNPHGDAQDELARTRACYSRYTRITAVGDQIIHFSHAANLLRYELCHRGVGAVQEVGPFSMVVNLGYHAVRLRGIRFDGAAGWRTPLLLRTLKLPGAVLADVNRVAELWKGAQD